MASKLDFLNPNSQNKIQKVGFIITIFLLIGLLCLHNPFRGYKTFYYYSEEGLWGDLIAETKGVKGYSLNFLDWKSNGAFSKNVSRIKDLMGFSFLVLVFGISWLWIFQDRNESKIR